MDTTLQSWEIFKVALLLLLSFSDYMLEQLKVSLRYPLTLLVFFFYFFSLLFLLCFEWEIIGISGNAAWR